MLKTTIKDFNTFKYLLLENDAIGKHIVNNNKWEPEIQIIIEELVTTKDFVNVLDLGANFGYHTLNLCRAIPNGVIHSFEPLKIIFQQLNGNIFINGFENVITYNKCVGDKSDNVEMEKVDYNSELVNIGNTKITKIGGNIEMITVDSLKLDSISFMKIDTQGSEMNVLRGSVNSIINSNPIIIVEIEEHHLSCFNTNGFQIMEFIKNLGYRIFRIENNYPCDHLCIPINNVSILNKITDKIKLSEI